MKNICFFNGDMSRNGGTERCTALMANELSKTGKYSVFVIDISNRSGTHYFNLDTNIRMIHLSGYSVLDLIKAVRKFIKSNKIDTIINVEAMLGIYTVPNTILSKTKNIIWEHGNFYQKQCRSIDKVRALEIRLCDHYITLTERDKQNFKNNFKGKCKIDYIYNPVVIPKEEPIYGGNTKTILSVGLIREIKGFDYLIEAAKIVLKKHPDWQWLIYGNKTDNEEYINLLLAKIQEDGLQNNVIFMGSTKDIESCYRNTDIMVMTSRMEGLPMTLLEAKAHKLPIVSFDIETGPSEIIDDGVNGYLVRPYDTDEMADKICRLIEDEELRNSFSENAYVGIEKFDVDNVVKKWIEIIED